MKSPALIFEHVALSVGDLGTNIHKLLLKQPTSALLCWSVCNGMLQGKANRTISSLAVRPVGDDLTGGGTVRICGGEGWKELE